MDALEKASLVPAIMEHEIWFINANGILRKNNNNNCYFSTIAMTSIVLPILLFHFNVTC